MKALLCLMMAVPNLAVGGRCDAAFDEIESLLDRQMEIDGQEFRRILVLNYERLGRLAKGGAAIDRRLFRDLGAIMRVVVEPDESIAAALALYARYER